MKTTEIMAIGLLLATVAAGFAAAPETLLSEAGQKLKARYADQLKALRVEIETALPQIDEQKKAAYLAAREEVKKAEAAVAAAQQLLAKIPEAKGAVGIWKKYSLPDATKRIAEAREQLKTATTDDARAAAQKTLAVQEERLASVTARLKAAEEEIAKSESVQGKDAQAKLVQASQAAQAALAQANGLAAAKLLLSAGGACLTSDRLDASLVKFVVLFEATPRGLAEFAQQGAEQAARVEELLADNDLMKRMLMADGAAGGNYGRALEIHTAIRKACPKAKDGVLQQLALAVALEHAVPVKQDNPAEKKAAPATVDPVKRYLAYEKAYADGELDAAFKDLTAWDLRFVVNGDEPDETAAWGREMLRNYRPDIIFDPDYAWRYVNAVRTDVKYGSQDCKFDRPSLQNYQNIIMNGGVCGRRAFFGRFILRAFGIPTAARPQSGHGALIHWTPGGWVPCLGGGWGSGWTATRYNGDLDFLATTQVRAAGAASLLEVKRAQWIGDVVGEKRVFGFSCGEPGLWYGASLYRQMAIIEAAKAKTLAAIGTHLGEANESAETKAAAVVKAAVTDADKKVVVGANSVITIPAAACSGVQPVKSFLGGLQAFCGGGFSCEVDVPQPGKYLLTARVVTVRDGGKIQLTANGAKDAVDVVIPYTCGQWEQTQPVEVTLAQGKNALALAQPQRGFTLKAVTLTPVR
jgi:hypothetical protein